MDWILCTRVLSLVSDISRVAQEFARVIRVGGRVLITDIHPLHPYGSTGMSIPRGRVTVKTFKHSLEALRSTFEQCFRLESLQDFSLMQLAVKPSRLEFEKLHLNPESPIFYCYRLVRVL